ncbi:MAG: hypothetical protein DHS20C20_11370 [Ardenticatenaceae bacterium]|nr:MAG: hypothetical protein DHS20C20_11370 [Ardenticatenaceae bacterium]
MSQSTLRQVLTIFETAVTPLSLPQIARDLNVSPARLEGMIQHWVRKGKIRQSTALSECGSCGENGGCPFVLDMPRTYELATNQENIPLNMVNITCSQFTDK